MEGEQQINDVIVVQAEEEDKENQVGSPMKNHSERSHSSEKHSEEEGTEEVEQHLSTSQEMLEPHSPMERVERGQIEEEKAGYQETDMSVNNSNLIENQSEQTEADSQKEQLISQIATSQIIEQQPVPQEQSPQKKTPLTKH